MSENNEKMSLKEYKIYLGKIIEAVDLAEKKGEEIEKIKSDMRYVVSPILLEEKKAELKEKEEDKEYFDKSNKSAIIDAIKKYDKIKEKLLNEFRTEHKSLLDKKSKLEEKRNQIQLETNKERESRIEELKESYEKDLRETELNDTSEDKKIYNMKKKVIEKRLSILENRDSEVAEIDEKISGIDDDITKLQLEYINNTQSIENDVKYIDNKLSRIDIVDDIKKGNPDLFKDDIIDEEIEEVPVVSSDVEKVEPKKEVNKTDRKSSVNDVNNIEIVAKTKSGKLKGKPSISFIGKGLPQTELAHYWENDLSIANTIRVIGELYGMNTSSASKEVEQFKAKFKNADPNILRVLKDNKERLDEYVSLLNGTKKYDKDDENALKISYDIRGLNSIYSKDSKNMKKEDKEKLKKEKEALFTAAYNHRDIAEVKATLFQKIRFGFRSFRERLSRDKNVKALPSGDISRDLPKDDSKGLSRDLSTDLSKYTSTVYTNEDKDKFLKDIIVPEVKISDKLNKEASKSDDVKEIKFTDYNKISKDDR